jgi:hypothetical protein
MTEIDLKVENSEESEENNIIGNNDLEEIYANDNIDCRREFALWKSVILQALVDLKNKSKKKMGKINRIKALMWFNLANKEFRAVCACADLDPLYVWEKAQIIKKNNIML